MISRSSAARDWADRSYSGLPLSMVWLMIRGETRKMPLLLRGFSTWMSSWHTGITSPSDVKVRRITCGEAAALSLASYPVLVVPEELKFHLQLHGGGDDHTLPQVSDSEHEGGSAVSSGDDGVPGENERLRPPVGLRRLHEDAAEHHGVDDQPQNVLDDQDDDGDGTLLRHHPAAESDGHLESEGERYQIRVRLESN